MNEDLKIQGFLNHLETKGNLKTLTTNFDNTREPIHRWFPFLAGFSNKLVAETVNYFDMVHNNAVMFDPFMGTGTTGVIAKEYGIKTIGNESNRLLHRICKLKTNLYFKPNSIKLSSQQLLKKVETKWKYEDISGEHELLKKCFPEENLKKLVSLRQELIENQDIPKTHKEYLFMALTMALPKSSSVRINIPYVSWSHRREPIDAFSLLKSNINLIKGDLDNALSNYKNNTKVKVYLHDTRKENKRIKKKSVDFVFTSPPYLNNFDYGESLKVFLYFWGFAKDWSEITDKIRKPSVTSATTYYRESLLREKEYEDIFGNKLIKKIPNMSQEIMTKVRQISLQKEGRKSKKSFDVLTTLYFRDMYLSLTEMFRVMKENTLAFLIVGDSAPYGVHVPTDTFLGEMAVELGFSSYTLKPIRIRGTKWKTLKHRHKEKLRESIIILRR